MYVDYDGQMKTFYSLTKLTPKMMKRNKYGKK